jgi:4-amino-4-deoxy-L-arabinose transferase-like glycosyltransferase
MSRLKTHSIQSWVCWALLGLIVLGAGLRVWGITYGLPYLYHPDEPLGINAGINMLRTGDLNPHFFGYGSLFFYLNALTSLVYFVAGKAIGVFHTPTDIPALQQITLGVGQSLLPTQVIVDRLASVLTGVLCIPVAYWLGRKLTDRVVGLLAAVLVTFSPTLVLHSIFVTPNILATLMVMLTLLALLRLTPTSRWSSFVLVGMAFGGAVASKYNDVLLVLPMTVTYLFVYGRSVWKKPLVYLSFLVAGLTFLAVTPYAILDFNKFSADTLYHLDYYSVANHPGMQGHTLEFYVTYLLSTEGLTAFIGLAAALTYVKPRNRNGLILAAFAVPYVIYISSLRVRNDRTILIVLPILLVMAADALVRLWRLPTATSVWRFRVRTAIALFVIVSIGYMSLQTVKQNIQLVTLDGREYARQWIAANVPPETRLAAETYTPFMDPQRYQVNYLSGLRLNPPEWYVAQGYDLLVFSSGAYQRFYMYPEMYPTEIAQYEALFSRFPTVAEFDQNGMTIRILKVKP